MPDHLHDICPHGRVVGGCGECVIEAWQRQIEPAPTPPHPTAPARGEGETIHTPTVVTCDCGAVIHAGDGHVCPATTGTGEVPPEGWPAWLRRVAADIANGPDGEFAPYLRDAASVLETQADQLRAAREALTAISYAAEDYVDTNLAHDDPARAVAIMGDVIRAAREEAARLGRTIARMEREYAAGQRLWEQQLTAYTDARHKAERELHEARDTVDDLLRTSRAVDEHIRLNKRQYGDLAATLAARDAELAGVRAVLCDLRNTRLPTPIAEAIARIASSERVGECEAAGRALRLTAVLENIRPALAFYADQATYEMDDDLDMPYTLDKCGEQARLALALCDAVLDRGRISQTTYQNERNNA